MSDPTPIKPEYLYAFTNARRSKSTYYAWQLSTDYVYTVSSTPSENDPIFSREGDQMIPIEGEVVVSYDSVNNTITDTSEDVFTRFAGQDMDASLQPETAYTDTTTLVNEMELYNSNGDKSGYIAINVDENKFDLAVKLTVNTNPSTVPVQFTIDGETISGHSVIVPVGTEVTYQVFEEGYIVVPATTITLFQCMEFSHELVEPVREYSVTYDDEQYTTVICTDDNGTYLSIRSVKADPANIGEDFIITEQ